PDHVVVVGIEARLILGAVDEANARLDAESFQVPCEAQEEALVAARRRQHFEGQLLAGRLRDQPAALEAVARFSEKLQGDAPVVAIAPIAFGHWKAEFARQNLRLNLVHEWGQ